MVLLSEKGRHGVSSRCEKVCMLLPQGSQSSSLENDVLFIADSTTVASQTNPVSPVYMASTSYTADNNWQAMTAQPKLQKSLHAPPGNRKLTIPSTWAIRLKPLLVCASNNTLTGGCTRTMQTARTCSPQECSQASTTPSTSNKGTTSCTHGISKPTECKLLPMS